MSTSYLMTEHKRYRLQSQKQQLGNQLRIENIE